MHKSNQNKRAALFNDSLNKDSGSAYFQFQVPLKIKRTRVLVT